MAKKKDKSKNVAGLKVPKGMRKGLVASFVEDPRTREILADVLMAAAGAAAAALIKHRPSAQQVAEAGASAAGATRDAVQSAAEAVTGTVADAARHILPASLTGAGERGESRDAEDGRPNKDSYAHLSDRDTKGKKDKRSKASKH